MRRVPVSNPARPSFAVAALTTALCMGPLLPASASPSADGVQLIVEGVGVGTFADARLATNPSSGDEQPDPLCLRLEGASPENPRALVDWMRSTIPEQNEDGVSALPDATLTVMSDRPGVKRGVYRLRDVSVRHVRFDTAASASGGRLEGAEITCSAVDATARSNRAG